MFFLLRSVIRFISLIVFLFSFILFLNYLNGWILIIPPLAKNAELQIESTKQEGERLKQLKAEMQATGQPESDNSLLHGIDYRLGSINTVVTGIRTTIEILVSLITFALSSILVLVAWRPDPIYDSKT